ncbi:MAG: DsbA family protein [Acidobacteriota bacterium]|nr:DsbA family protein [Acidobacteriota bacterium]
MFKNHLTLRNLTLGLLVACLALGGLTTLAETDNSDARKAKILANLKLQFPQLDAMNATMGDLKASGYEGLDEGSFTLTGQRGPQTQTFLVSSDDTKLYLVNGQPLDVSRSSEEIEAEMAERAAEEMRKAEDTAKRLEEAVAGRPMLGNPDAAVTIVEFSDFQCPFCARGANTVEEILEKYGDDVKVAFMHFPLGFHPWAKPAAIAAHCAGELEDEAFWTLHDGYFADQKQITPENVLDKSRELLADSGIDMDVWSECATNEESDAYKAAAAVVDADMALGGEVGVSGTPGFFVNGQLISGAQPLSAFEPLIEAAKKGSMEGDSMEAESE